MYIRGQKILSLKGQLVSSLGPLVSVATIQVCSYRTEEAVKYVKRIGKYFNKTLFEFQIIYSETLFLCAYKYMCGLSACL